MVPQHMQALETANRIRLERAALKRRVYAGETTVIDVLRDPPECMDSCSIEELLRAQLRWGKARARRFTARYSIRVNRPIGRLTVRQRDILIEGLERKGVVATAVQPV